MSRVIIPKRPRANSLNPLSQAQQSWITIGGLSVSTGAKGRKQSAVCSWQGGRPLVITLIRRLRVDWLSFPKRQKLSSWLLTYTSIKGCPFGRLSTGSMKQTQNPNVAIPGKNHPCQRSWKILLISAQYSIINSNEMKQEHCAD